MTTDTAKKIEDYIAENRQATAKQLVDFLGISPQALFKQLAKLQEKKKIYKMGKPPKVFYFIVDKNGSVEGSSLLNIDKSAQKIIDKNYIFITPAGEKKEGLRGFRYWCNKTGQPFEKTVMEYVKTWRKYDSFKKNGLIDCTSKLKNTFPAVCLDKLYYLDFYNIERFGKTKLGQLLLYAKQSQNIKMIKELIAGIRPQIQYLIEKYKIEAVGFVPPTVKREIQFMKELENNLHLNLKKISIVKIKTEIAVPQKTLNKLEDRIENAQKTILVESRDRYKNILIIDDAVGSGATINETAAQIKQKGLSGGKIIGLAITGSFKGFDVISEV
ncbi:hypothetical protein HZA40_05035 [Candidatus Peregrinibacteria bacterium]|nr:hypothetical protein [Candidatus Peregrinibacteria bacterium]